jgi:hypothetical protein
MFSSPHRWWMKIWCHCDVVLPEDVLKCSLPYLQAFVPGTCCYLAGLYGQCWRINSFCDNGSILTQCYYYCVICPVLFAMWTFLGTQMSRVGVSYGVQFHTAGNALMFLLVIEQSHTDVVSCVDFVWHMVWRVCCSSHKWNSGFFFSTWWDSCYYKCKLDSARIPLNHFVNASSKFVPRIRTRNDKINPLVAKADNHAAEANLG